MKKVTLFIAALVLFVFAAPPFLSAESSGSFSLIQIREIAVKGHKLHVRGETDLPPGSALHLKIWLPWPGTQGNSHTVKVHVNSRHFFAMVNLPKKNSYSGLTALLRILFRPSEQGKDVKGKVGDKGQNLKGDNVLRENGQNILRDEKKMTL